MILICSICGKSFKYKKPLSTNNSPLPTVCGHRGQDGKWVRTPACQRERNRRASAAYRLKKGRSPTNLEYGYCLQCGKRFKTTNHVNTICSDECRKIRKLEYYKRYAEKRGEYDYRGTPQPDKYYKCQHCGKWTVNRFNCSQCLAVLMEWVSEQYPDSIYEGGVDVWDVRAIKDGPRYDNT